MLPQTLALAAIQPILSLAGPILGAIGIAYAFVLAKQVLAKPDGNDAMRKIAKAIQEKIQGQARNG